MNITTENSPAAQMIYGFKSVSEESWLHYAYSLLIIAGGDGEVSEAELKWLVEDFSRIIDASEDFKKKINDFNYHEAKLEDQIKHIHFGDKINFKNALIYDAVRMSLADNEYSEGEKEAVKQVAGLLKVPEYISRTLEGLIKTERSIEYTRRSIFFSNNAVGEEMRPGFRKTNSLVKNFYGIEITSDEIELNCGYALMAIAGADGEVSDKEKAWYRDEYAVVAGLPEAIVNAVLEVNFIRLNLEEVLLDLKSHTKQDFSKLLLYNAVRMSRADEEFAEAEKASLLRAAAVLNIPSTTAQTIDYLAEAEINLERMRHNLFRDA